MQTPTEATELPPDLGALYEEQSARLWRAIRAFSGSPEIASDAVAEAFAQCLRRGSAIRDPRAWIWRSAFRIAGGELQRRGRESHDVPEASYEMPDDLADLLVALDALSPTQRAVLVLRHYMGEPTDRIAHILGMSRATVRVHLSRGHRRLATGLEGSDDA